MFRYLMNGDVPVLGYDMQEHYMQVINNDMLPYELKDYVVTTDLGSREGINKAMDDMDALRYFLSGRVLDISRSNAKAILGSSALPRVLNTENALIIADACHGLSINDNFWIKHENEDIGFDDIDIRHNPLFNSAYDIAILGKHIAVTADDLKPELVTDGMFPKVWRRTGNTLELWKTDLTGSFANTLAEIKVSQILDSSNVKHVKYKLREEGRLMFAVSRCVSGKKLSHISAQSVRDWCRHTGRDFLGYVEEKFPDDFHRMVFSDYVFANTDRHFGNWWFEVDADSNNITGFGALMDHNQALIADEFGTDINDLIYEPTGLTFGETVRKYAGFINELSVNKSLFPEKCMERYKYVTDFDHSMKGHGMKGHDISKLPRRGDKDFDKTFESRLSQADAVLPGSSGILSGPENDGPDV